MQFLEEQEKLTVIATIITTTAHQLNIVKVYTFSIYIVRERGSAREVSIKIVGTKTTKKKQNLR